MFKSVSVNRSSLSLKVFFDMFPFGDVDYCTNETGNRPDRSLKCGLMEG